MNDGIYKKFSNWYAFYKDVPSGVQIRKYKTGTLYPDIFVPDKTQEKDKKIELFCLFQGTKMSGYKIPVLYFLNFVLH